MRPPSVLVNGLLLIAAAGGLCAAEPVAAKPVEARLLLGLVPAYEVTEGRPDSGGGNTDYVWDGTDNHGRAVALQVAWALEPSGGVKPILGVELMIHGATLTPTGYSGGGSTYGNADGEEFSYLAVTPMVIAGLRVLEPHDERLGMLLELQAGLGFSVIHGEIENGYGDSAGIGLAGDATIRALFALQEQGWTGGVLVGLRGSWGGLEIDQSDGSGSFTSDLTLEAVGAEAMLVVGRTF
jgi:hypothetical protein